MKQTSKKFKKFLSLTLCLMMVLGSVAVGGDGIAELLDNFTVEANAEETGFKAGDSIYLGKYPQSEIYNITGLTKDVDYVTVNNKYYAYEPIEWIVLDAEKGLCVSKYALDTIAFETTAYKSNDYKLSHIRKWLYGDNGTGTFYTNAFTDTEKSLILKNNIVTYKYDSYTDVASTLTDKVFLLSFQEACNTSYFADNSERICYPTPYAYADGAYVNCRWWLRTPGGYTYDVAYVGNDGSIQDFGDPSGSSDIRVRPAIYLNFESEAFESEITFYANNGTDEHIKNTVTSFKNYYPDCTFSNGTKTFCGWYKDAECQQPWTEIDIVSDDMTLYAGWTEFKTGDIIEFGSYPQSKVSDTTLISELDSVSKSWTSYGYYIGTGVYDDGNMTSSDYMKYADFIYGGTKYRAVTFSEYRPDGIGYTSTAGHSKQDEYGYEAGADKIYYFRYEPIKWKILDPATGLVLTDALLDSQPYNNYLLCESDVSDPYYSSGVDNATYTGKPIERNIVVKDGDKTLAEITDYTVSYNNNTNAGTDATVTITGKGNYCSEVIKTFTISPATQSTPTDITSTDETKCSASDGTISGLSTDMEIAYERGEYTPCISETMTGLAPGTYSIRYAEKANYVASDSVQVVIKEGDCYGGTATCINKAVCDGCHNEYGELGDHEWKDSYTVDKEPTITEAGSESIHCKLCSATKDSKAILSLTDSHEEYKQASVEKLDSLNTEHDSVISKIIVRFADFVIERCGYDETKSYEENTAVIDKIVEEATDMINTRHYLIYGCPFLSFIANKLEPCFVAVRCFVNFVIVQIKNVF